MTLRKLIEEKGTTMYRIAKECNLGQTTINEIVNGKRKEIKLETAIKIADALDVDVKKIYELIGGSNGA